MAASSRLGQTTRHRPAAGGRALTAASLAMVLVWPLGLLLAVTVSRLADGAAGTTLARVSFNVLGLLVMALPQAAGVWLAVLALRRLASRQLLAWLALTANLVVLALPFFLSAGGGNLANVSALVAVSALAVWRANRA